MFPFPYIIKFRVLRCEVMWTLECNCFTHVSFSNSWCLLFFIRAGTILLLLNMEERVSIIYFWKRRNLIILIMQNLFSIVFVEEYFKLAIIKLFGQDVVSYFNDEVYYHNHFFGKYSGIKKLLNYAWLIFLFKNETATLFTSIII